MPEGEISTETAITAALAQNWKEAIRINSAILVQKKNDIDALNRLGFAYLQSGQISTAKKTFQQVINLDPYNQIANRNLKKLTTLKRKNLTQVSQTLSPLMFLEDPGKTKIVNCINLAPVQVLSCLYAGQAVELRAKNHCVEIRDLKNVYLGALPDDLSFKLIKFINAGNRYQALIKGISKNSLTLFLREIYRSKRFAHQPSFTTSGGFISNIHLKAANLTDTAPPLDGEGETESEEI